MGYTVYRCMPCIAGVPYRVRGLPGLHFLGGGVEMMFPKKPYTKQRKARAAKRSTSRPESALQKQCNNLLDAMGITYVRVPDEVYRFIFASRAVPVHIKAKVSASIAGQPDIIILLPNGRYHCIELKNEIGKLSAGQKRFRNSVGIDNFTVCRTIEEVQAVINSIKK